VDELIQPRRIYDMGLPHRAVTVFCYLCRCANKKGVCYPAVRTIAKDISLCRSTVFKALNDLERHGLITRTHRFHPSGAKRSSLYKIIGEITKGGDG